MNLISVYVAVGAISFVKCELDYNSAMPFRGWRQNGIFPGEWNLRGKSLQEKKLRAELEESSEAEKKPLIGEKESAEKKKEFFEGFRQIKNIYSECREKVNERFKNTTKVKVKSRLPELKSYFLSLYQCVKVFSFRLLDEILQDDFIPVTDYAYFVKDGLNLAEEVPSGRKVSSLHTSAPTKDFAARVLGQGWTTLVGDRLENLLRTHSLKFQLDKSLIPQGRGRRRDHRMFAMMVMGFMIMASILIPMGFQFLTVLGGKSLLLAKMALIMSAINGLKKIATSNVGYGFYHTGSDGHHHDHLHHGFHEKHFHANPANYNNLQGYN